MSKTIEYFKQITKYPRPSKNEEKIRDFLINWAQENNFEYEVDNIGNLLIKVSSKNCNSKEIITLQSHMDMVCVKGDDSSHNFSSDSIEIIEKDGFLTANNTTLGADNGIGMALSMSATHFNSHPQLELLFTVDEEQGMSGALGMKKGFLSGTKLINLDFDDEKVICVSSAGGKSVYIEKELEYGVEVNIPVYRLFLYGLKGGHSGVEIDKNHGSIIDLFTKFLVKTDLINCIYYIKSGVAENVIPSELEVICSISDIEKFKTQLEDYIEECKNIFDCPNFGYKIESIEFSGKTNSNLLDILKQIAGVKVGVYKMSENIEGLVETSANLGIIKIEDNKVKFVYSVRSSKNNELENLINEIKTFYEKLGFQTEINGGYPGWQDNPNGLLVSTAREEIEKVIGTKPTIFAVHAGLECGAIVSVMPEGASAISVGPNAYDIHSVNERVEIASVERYERILENILARL